LNTPIGRLVANTAPPLFSVFIRIPSISACANSASNALDFSDSQYIVRLTIYCEFLTEFESSFILLKNVPIYCKKTVYQKNPLKNLLWHEVCNNKSVVFTMIHERRLSDSSRDFAGRSFDFAVTVHSPSPNPSHQGRGR
jgi:hypothetical protein